MSSQAPRRSSRVACRAALAAMCVASLTVGGWATISPGPFYDAFPGLGSFWVSVDGPYNEHLIRDVGALNLALFAVTVTALVLVGNRPLVLAAAAANAIFGLPHLVYHTIHRHSLPAGDQVAELASLSIPVAAAALAALTSGRAASKIGSGRSALIDPEHTVGAVVLDR